MAFGEQATAFEASGGVFAKVIWVDGLNAQKNSRISGCFCIEWEFLQSFWEPTTPLSDLAIVAHSDIRKSIGCACFSGFSNAAVSKYLHYSYELFVIWPLTDDARWPDVTYIRSIPS